MHTTQHYTYMCGRVLFNEQSCYTGKPESNQEELKGFCFVVELENPNTKERLVSDRNDDELSFCFGVLLVNLVLGLASWCYLILVLN